MWLTAKEVSTTYKFKLSTLYLWVEQGKIPHYKVGRLVRFKSEEVEEWLGGFKNTSSAPHKASRRHVRANIGIDVDEIARKAIDAAKGLKV